MVRRTFSCCAPYGAGGMGRLLLEASQRSREAGELSRYFAGSVNPGDARIGQVVNVPSWVRWLSLYTPVRFNPGMRQYLVLDRFDRCVADQLRERADAHFGFAGQALHTFRKARALGYSRLELLAPTAHLDRVARQHELARRQYPIERDWLNESHRRKALAEYAMADAIFVISEYARQSFLDAGVAETRLVRLHCRADGRFTPPPRRPGGEQFHIVCTGAVSVVKGIPLVLEAFDTLRVQHARLTLVGGTGTRAMRRYVERWMARDPRIALAPGDPLRHLHDANVYVQPSYQDGLGFGALEAMSCGVPVIVTEDTGAKEYVRPGENGLVIPTGDVQALVDAIEAIRVGVEAGPQGPALRPS